VQALVIYKGKIVDRVVPDELIRNPTHEYTKTTGKLSNIIQKVGVGILSLSTEVHRYFLAILF
jgi:ABC-type oligopeptide transport system ATPase subunit